MTTENASPTPNSCGHHVGGECSCSDHIARFGELGGWDHRTNKVGTVRVLRGMNSSGLLSRRELLADMHDRDFPSEELDTLGNLIDGVQAAT